MSRAAGLEASSDITSMVFRPIHQGAFMGYRGDKGNYEERDKLFQQSFDGKPVNRNEVKKNLDGLFKEKTKAAEEPCLKGHAWIRDFDGKTKCAYCKTLRPAT